MNLGNGTQVEGIIDWMLSGVFKKVNALVDKVFNEAMALEEKVIHDVDACATDILNKLTTDVEDIIQDIADKVSALLHDLEKVGETLFCAAQGYIETLEQTFSSFFQKQDCECVQEFNKLHPGLA
jgi:CO dehydrogenase/acetyl-CoA synthase alpha subunit